MKHHLKNAEQMVSTILRTLQNAPPSEKMTGTQVINRNKLVRVQRLLVCFLVEGAEKRYAIEELSESRIVFCYIKDFVLERRSLNIDYSLTSI